jgi:RimJ/RimL family protein N-acetyltransferase
MLKLVEVNEQNWMDYKKLSVSDGQKGYLDSAIGIIARGYVYRDARARVIGVADGDIAVGLALVKDMDDEPACYDLQQFMIDQRYQGRGFGTRALRKILAELEKERKYDSVEVCVKMEDAAALRVYKKVGFVDTGYIDEEVPDSFNYTYRFPERK